MDFMLADSKSAIGRIVFTQVTAEEWVTPQGNNTTMELINMNATRYYGGPEEPSDLGSINAITFEEGSWKIYGDWGMGRLTSQNQPMILFELPPNESLSGQSS